MLEKDFLKLCETELFKLSEHIEMLDKNFKLDVEYSDGILEIVVLATKQTYIINRNSGNQKIWYSSPISGADYFSFDEKTASWVNVKGEEISQKLFSEIKKFF
jgi:iron donor protein CyaY